MSSARIEELRKKFDENPRRYFAPLANEYRKAGDFDQAIFICQEYLPQQPGHMSGHIVFGQALFEAKRLPEAKAVFETALSLDPENLIALRHLADISRDLGDAAAARTWYERVLQADPRNEEIADIMSKLGTGSAPSPAVIAAAAAPTAETPAKPVPPPAPAASKAPAAASASAPTVELSAAAVQEMLKARQAAKAPPAPPPAAEPELLTIDAAPTVEIGAVAEAAPMEGLEPTSQAGMMDLPTIEPMGLETNAAPGIHAEPAAAVAAPLDGLDTIPLDISVPGAEPMLEVPAATPPAAEPAAVGDDLLDLGSFDLGGATPPPAAPAPSPAETPIDGGHDTGELLDLDIPTPAPAEDSSIPTIVLDAVKSVVPAVQEAVESAVPAVVGAVESAAPAVMDFLDTTIPAVVDAVQDAVPAVVEAVAETPTVIMEAIKPPTPPLAAADARSSQSVPFVTETMAQLYLSQGHRTEAIDIYRKLIEARPGDTELRARLAAIESEARQSPPAAAPAPAPPPAAPAAAPRRFTGAGPSIRVVLRELFGLDGSTTFASAPSAAMPAEAGSIDMLFATDAVADVLNPLAVAFDGGFVATRGTIDELFAGGGQ